MNAVHTPSVGDAEGASTSWRSSSRLRVILVWATITCTALVRLDRLRATTTLFFDEWTFLFDRRGPWAEALLEPHNGHLSALPVLAYRLMFSVVGLDHQHPYRLMGLAIHAAVATAVAVYCRRRMGAVGGIALGAVVLLLGSGWQNILWPFQIGFMGSLAAAVIAWLAMDHRTRFADGVASAALVVALACSGLGIAAAAGSALRLGAERAWIRALRVLAAPALMYGGWYLAYGQSQGAASNLPKAPRFVVDAAGGAAGGLFGRDLLWGHLLAGALAATCVVLAAQRRLGTSIVAPAGAATVNWVLTAYSRADIGEPAASRYVYVGGVLILLAIADAVADTRLSAVPADLARRWPAASRLPKAWWTVPIAALCVCGNWALLNAGAAGLRSTTSTTRAELRAVEWGTSVEQNYRPDTQRMPQVAAGPYLAAVDELGSPAAADAEVAGAPADARSEVDRVSLQLMGLGADADGMVAVLPPGVDDASCLEITAGADGVHHAAIDTSTGPGWVLVVSAGGGAEVTARRYADQATLAAKVEAGGTGRLQLRRDHAPISLWHVDVIGASYVAACP